MRFRLIVSVMGIAVGACAPTRPLEESPVHAARMQQAGAAYTGCVASEAEKSLKNPAGAEDIAVAAHSRCWSAWEAYRDATRVNFFHGARTSGERQLAGDKMDAHLREFELETRRTVIDSVIQRTHPAPR